MTRWTALVPLRLGPETKTRLAALYDASQRITLATALARHVCDTLARCAAVERVVLLAPERPDWLQGEWAPDGGGGLNHELGAFRAAHRALPLLTVLGDLPLLAVDDVEALLAGTGAAGAAGYHRAMAPDHAGQGTNALALTAGTEADFRFGENSRKAFRRLYPDMVEVIRPGLAHDLDTPQDLARLRQMGWRGGDVAA